jgi:hypothetical protein
MRTSLIAIGLAAVASCAASAAAQCGEWEIAGALPPGVSDVVGAVAPWDPDGDGPTPARLVARGTFALAGVGRVNGIAAWDGVAWRPLADGFTPIPPASAVPEGALATWDPDGNGPQPARLIAGGGFSHAGSTLVNGIAQWNGSAWLPLGTGVVNGAVSGEVRAIASWDPDGAGPVLPRLIAGGVFTSASGTPASNIAWWDGQSWRALGAGMNGAVHALTTWDPDGPGPLGEQLIAGGAFSTAGGVTANRLARWDGSTWQPLSSGLTFGTTGALASALTTWDPDGPGPLRAELVVVGAFDRAGGVAANRVARWDGATFRAFGSGLNGNALAVTTWDSDGPGPLQAQVIVGGLFSSSTAGQPRGIARWDGTAWVSVRANVFEPSPVVRALTTWDADADGPLERELIAGGEFQTMGGTWTNHIARNRGSDWQPLGGPVLGALGSGREVGALLPFDPDGPGTAPSSLVLGGSFRSLAGLTANSIARWDGNTWNTLGGGLPNGRGGQLARVAALTLWDPDASGPLSPQLVVGGVFASTGATTLNSIARWDGSVWRAFGVGVSGGATAPAVEALTTWDPDGTGPLASQVIAGGDFASASNATVNGIARWDGSLWRNIGGGVSRVGGFNVRALATLDPDGPGPLQPELIAGGLFDAAGGVPAINIARWNGTAWRAMGAGLDGQVSVLRLWDLDGSGPNPPVLVAGGSFTRSGTTVVNRIARWDGNAWQPLGTGVSGGASPAVLVLGEIEPTLAGPFQRELLVAGEFSIAGQTPVTNVARWDGAVWRPYTSGRGGRVSAVSAWHANLANTPARIYFADNMSTWGASLVAWNTEPPTVAQEPQSIAVERGGVASFSVQLRSAGGATLRWRRNGVALVDGPTASGGVIAGSATPVLRIVGVGQADAGAYSVQASTACGRLASSSASLVVTPPAAACDYDFNQDQNVDLTDSQQMAQVVAGVLQRQPTWLDGDLNRDENADLYDAQLLSIYVVTGVCNAG